ILGAVLAGLTALGSPLIAAFYGKPELATIAKLLGLSFFISSFVHVPAALLRKALDFRKLVLIGICCRLVGGAVGITLAFLGFGVYALVYQGLSRALLYSIAVWFAVGWRPRWTFRLKSVTGMVRFGANLTGAGFLAYLACNMDYLLIGRFLGAAALGVYTIAYQIMLLPLRRVSSQLARVAFPAFSSVQQDKGRVRRGYLQMTSIIALASFPAMMGLLVVAPEAVPVLLGEKWLRSIVLIQVLALSGALQSVTGTAGSLYRSQGRTDVQFRLELLTTPVVRAAFVIGLRWNVEGVAVCYTISQLIVIPVKCHFAFKLVGLSFREMYRALRGPLLASVSMAALVVSYRLLAIWLLGPSTPVLLCSEIALGVAAYAAALAAVEPTAYAQFFGVLKLLGSHRRQAESGTTPTQELMSS
ncbi:MAG: lipopolysaccharide biosynthesis protein, partial [Candidatus Brocadiae bacterium]|nr:lipopolysaccharide biosynthesis protein [Candidatus Brocadiia bacterium]